MATAVIQPKRWTRAEYERMVEAGIFQPGDHVELINGEILAMSPQESPHATAVGLVQDALRLAFDPSQSHVREEKPFVAGPDSLPEPDVAVVPGDRRDYGHQHPAKALLIVEVAESSLTYDRKIKAPLYAQAGVAEYWIVNLTERRLEVYREPLETSAGWGYRTIRLLTATDCLNPLAAPHASVTVADLLP